MLSLSADSDVRDGPSSLLNSNSYFTSPQSLFIIVPNLLGLVVATVEQVDDHRDEARIYHTLHLVLIPCSDVRQEPDSLLVDLLLHVRE